MHVFVAANLDTFEEKADLDPWSVRFRDSALERDFRRYSTERDNATDQFILLSGVGIFIAYGFLDWLTLGDLAIWVIGLRIASAPLSISLILWTYTPRGRAHMQAVSTIIMGLGTICLALMVYSLGLVSPPYYVGILHFAIAFSSIIRVNFRVCLALLLFMYGSIAVATINIPKGPDLYAAHFFLISILTSCAMVNYFLERNRRNEFLQAQQRAAYYQQVQEMADEAERSVKRKNAILNVLGHVVKTPLHQIIGYAQIIEQTGKMQGGEDLSGFAEEIQRAGNTLSHQSQRLLDFSRADSGLISPVLKKTTPARLVREALYRNETAATEKAINIVQECDETEVLVDSRQLVRALEEIIDNAIQFSAPGASVTIKSNATAGGVVLTIADNGPGIPPEDLDRVIDAMNRTEDFRNVGGDKLGIGVSLARALVTIAGGKFYFASAPEHGTLVTFVLPYAEASTKDAKANESAAA